MKLAACALALAVSVAGAACHRSGDVRREPAPAARVARPEPPEPLVGFHSSRQLAEHFEKHGAEFGRITREEYLARAQQLRDARAGGDILEAVRRDGVVTRFDRRTGAFIAFDRDGTIRTFFRPNDGESYFVRQARR